MIHIHWEKDRNLQSVLENMTQIYAKINSLQI